jgi:hypothetical protein
MIGDKPSWKCKKCGSTELLTEEYGGCNYTRIFRNGRCVSEILDDVHNHIQTNRIRCLGCGNMWDDGQRLETTTLNELFEEVK